LQGMKMASCQTPLKLSRKLNRWIKNTIDDDDADADQWHQVQVADEMTF